jgi:hypothetical protein
MRGRSALKEAVREQTNLKWVKAKPQIDRPNEILM